jgi:Uma2 family endonuclease
MSTAERKGGRHSPPGGVQANGTPSAAAPHLTPSDAGRALTLEEFERARGQEGFRYELIDGKLEVSPQPELPHDCILEAIADQLRAYRREHPEVINKISTHARVFVPGRLPATCPEPDLAAYHDFPFHLPRGVRRWRDVSPILVVEVLSDNAEKDLIRNVELYRQVPSIREYWVLDPEGDPDRPDLRVYRRRGRSWQRPIDVPFGGVYATRLLPGFTLTVDEGT